MRAETSIGRRERRPDAAGSERGGVAAHAEFRVMSVAPQFASSVVELPRSVGYPVTTPEEAIEAAIHAIGVDRHHAVILLTGVGDVVHVP